MDEPGAVDEVAKAAAEKRAARRMWAWIAGGVLVVACAVAIPDGNDTDQGAQEELSAQDGCRTFVERQLKAPATADFTGWLATSDGSGAWTVDGTVDAENSFGAKIRSTFTCTMHDAGDKWILDDLSGL